MKFALLKYIIVQFRYDIQGFRALAFLLVFFFHLNAHWLPGGFLGVDIFFVISGYLMTLITIKEIDDKKFSFINFYQKRIKRIVPAYYFLLLIIAIVAPFIFLYTDLGTLRGTLIRSLLFISNFLFQSGNSYFGAQLSENPLLHTWSLGIEMQFYFFLPIIMYFFRKKILWILIPITLILSIYYTYQIGFNNLKSESYFSLIARVPEFLVGAVFAIIFPKGINTNRSISNTLAIISLLVLTLSVMLINENALFPGLLALIPCLSIAVLLSLKKNVISDIFSNKVLVFIGEMSYSLYLWHWPVMALVRYKKDAYEFNIQEIFFVIIVTIVLSLVSFYLIENKLNKIKNKSIFSILIISTLLIGAYIFSIPTIFNKNQFDKMYTSSLIGEKSLLDGIPEELGDSLKKSPIFLVGNSHAHNFKPVLDLIGKKHNFSFITLTANCFPPISGIEIDGNSDSQYYNEALSYIPISDSILNESEIILFIASFEMTFDNIINRKIINSLDVLTKNLKPNQKLILLKSFPRIEKNHLKITNSITNSHKENINIINPIKVNLFLDSLAINNKNIYTYNLFNLAIFANAPYINDTIAYYDANHINYYGATKLAKAIEDDLGGFINKLLNQ